MIFSIANSFISFLETVKIISAFTYYSFGVVSQQKFKIVAAEHGKMLYLVLAIGRDLILIVEAIISPPIEPIISPLKNE